MRKKTHIEIATVVFYDGVEAYTTHRALFVDDETMKMTKHSRDALKYDIDSCCGCEILKVDFNDRRFDDATDLMHNLTAIYHCDDSEVQYVKDKFVEYFIVND